MSRRAAPLDTSGPIIHGCELGRGFEEQCDVVVVGSGAGGATVATHLAEAGVRVLLLEEGPHVPPEQYQRFEPSESVRRLFREAGMLVALPDRSTPVMTVAVGKAVGGSSILTGGVCFRVPSEVHGRWQRELGLDALSERALAPAYLDVEQRLQPLEVPEALRSESTRVFVAGAEKLGIPMKPIRRNMTRACVGLGRCNFGCPAGAKRAVDTAYLPTAFAAGARLVSDALVERVLCEHGRAVGVSGRLLCGPGGRSTHRFVVRARAVVCACGTLHTPMLLRTAGVRSPSLGRHITVHPGARMVAIFPNELHGWDGALQGAYSDHFAADGITLVGVYSSVNMLAAGMPGIGPALNQRVRRIGQLGVFGAMIHDDGGGQVRRGFGREPMLAYRMASRDLGRLRRSFRILAEIALAAGAEEVLPPIFGAPPVRSSEQARALESDPIDPRRIESMAFHPLGSARMAREPRGGVVDSDGECFERPGLFVGDGSALPTSVGVNSQVPIMTVATHTAWRLRERLRMRLGRPG